MLKVGIPVNNYIKPNNIPIVDKVKGQYSGLLKKKWSVFLKIKCEIFNEKIVLNL